MVSDCVLTQFGSGEIIYELRKKIQNLEADLNKLGSISDIPELITSANLLRTNEYLSKANSIKTELLSTHKQYSESLEELLSVVFDIQQNLKEILKEQSSMLSVSTQKKLKSKPKSKPKSRSKSRK